MALKKQEFYEGAALHLLACTGGVRSISYKRPYFLVNERVLVHLKYSTGKRSPWGFSVTPEERRLLAEHATRVRLVIGLICGSDGVASVEHEDLAILAGVTAEVFHISCFRNHREHYEVSGPTGSLSRKISPSAWLKILEDA